MNRAAAAAMLLLGLAQAAAAAPTLIATPFDEDGYDASGYFTPGHCLVVTSINLATMVAKTADLQAKGLIRADVDAAHVKAHAWTTAAAIAIKLEPLFVVTVYRKHPELDVCRFGQAVVDFAGKPSVAYTFIMTRAIYDKQNWSAFAAADLPHVARDFTLGPAISEHMDAEAKLPD